MQIAGYEFDGPWQLSRFDTLDRAAVYVILCPSGDSKYTIVYVGETGQVNTRLSAHERAACWSRNCTSELYVAVKWTPTSQYDTEDRRNIEKQIRLKYDPTCNRQ